MTGGRGDCEVCPSLLLVMGSVQRCRQSSQINNVDVVREEWQVYCAGLAIRLRTVLWLLPQKEQRGSGFGEGRVSQNTVWSSQERHGGSHSRDPAFSSYAFDWHLSTG